MTGATALYRDWTPDEDAKLREAYASGGIKAAMDALPGRPKFGIYHRTQKLGIANRRRRWTPADDARLRRLWDSELPFIDICQRLGRTQITVYWRAQKIGLPLGVPDGWELLSHAAARTGYYTGQLRRILAADGVVVRRVLTRPVKHRGNPRFGRERYMVPIGAVDGAVEAWLETEPLQSAARRIGVCAQTLKRRLEAIGVRQPPKPSPQHHWRVRHDDVAAAVGAATMSQQSLFAAGVSP